ncbi:unnamed protein product [Effrenium voratum]|uniref:Uncharacterized protein n=1 Tax=Effrenium voratum TaxID=2562239 RepID=A0AA36JP38_9DINO|nr:unnamed protein product [Effrenium voratum]
MSYGRQLEQLEKNIASSAQNAAPRRVQELDQVLQRCGGQCSKEARAEMGGELAYLEKLSTRDMALSREVAEIRRRYDALDCQHAPRSSGEFDHLARGGEGETSQPLQVIAGFLYPQQEPRHAEDKVRLLAAEGALSSELYTHPVITYPESDCTIILGDLGPVMSWTEEDDAAEAARERMALLELSQAGANLVEVTNLMAAQIEQDQEGLDLMEERVAHALESTQQGVRTLAESAENEYRMMRLLTPSAGLMVLGGLAALACPLAGAPILVAAGRGAVLAGATLGTLSEVQKKLIRRLQEQLPRAFQKLPEDQVSMLEAACRETRDRLHRKLDDSEKWGEDWLLSAPFTRDFRSLYREGKLTVKRSPSDVRKGGSAYLVTFQVDLPASRVFGVMKKMFFSGSLDPGCKAVWSRPVDASPESGCFLRHLVYSEYFFSSEFSCACYCAEAPTGDCYTMATASLSDELLPFDVLPTSSNRGRIHVCGLRLTAIGDSRTKVEVMADVDPSVPLPTISLVDKRVRSHARDAAWLLRHKLKEAASGFEIYLLIY